MRIYDLLHELHRSVYITKKLLEETKLEELKSLLEEANKMIDRQYEIYKINRAVDEFIENDSKYAGEH